MKLPTVSDRLLEMPISAVRKLSPYAKEAKAQGVKIYHLNIGDPDIPTPQAMLDELHSFKPNPIRYADSHGEPQFLKAMEWYYHKLGYTFLNESHMVVTVGGSEAVVMSLFATAKAGEEILVFEPFYSNYSACASLAGVKLVPVPTSIDEGFHLPPQKVIEQKIGPKTRAILFCTPNNPTGTVYSKKEMDMLVAIAKKHKLFLISDEVYREFVYDDTQQISLLSYMKAVPDHAILLDSLSKRYSLCGARLGILASLNKDIIAGTLKIAQSRLSGGLIDQLMASKLTKVPKSYTDAVTKEYKKRRDILYKGLLEIPGVFLAKPEGAFYTIVNLPVTNAEDFCIYLLKEFRQNNETVMLAPGAGFYGSPTKGLNQVRMAYVLNENDLKKSLQILKSAITAYKKTNKFFSSSSVLSIA